MDRKLLCAIDAFDRLYEATCGKAADQEIAKHFGVHAAFEITHARRDMDRLRLAPTQKEAGDE